MKRHRHILKASGSVDAADLTLRAAIEFDRNGNTRIPRFNLLAYTGVPMTGVLKGQKLPIIVDLAGLEAPRADIPALKDHNPSLIVGHTDSIHNDGKSVRMSGLVSGEGEVAREVLRSAKNGFPWQASISAAKRDGYDVPRGKRVTLNGREWAGPLTVWSKSLIKEVSFVALGADADTTAAIAAAHKENAVKTFEEWLQAKGFDKDTLGETQLATLQAAYEADKETLAAQAGGGSGAGSEGGEGEGSGETTEGKPAKGAKGGKGKAGTATQTRRTLRASGSPRGTGGGGSGEGGGADAELDAQLNASRSDDGDEAPATLADVRAERKRVSEIERLCASHPAIREKAIDELWTPARAELAVLRASRPAIHARSGNDTENLGQTLEAALCRSAGLGSEFMEKEFDEKTLEASDHGDYRGIGVQGVFYEIIRAANMHAPRGNFNDETIRTAFRAEQTLRASGAFSTVSLPGILGSSANKAMLQAFLAYDGVILKIARKRSVKDFKTFTSLRLTASGSFSKVGPDGELKNIGLTESSYTNRLDTHGAIVALNRQMIINDDLGAFLQLPQHLGRLSAAALEETGFALLMSNPSSFFGTGNKNYIQGSTTNLSPASLTAAKKKFRQMKDTNGKHAMVKPRFLLVPSILEDTADRLYNSEVYNETTTANAPSPSRNPHKGKFEPIVAPLLDDDAMTDYSDTAWYLLADPADRAVIEAAFLNGRETPIIESGEVNFNQLGMQWRGYMDFGFGMAETVAGVKSLGVSE
jgi:hypothetical protein